MTDLGTKTVRRRVVTLRGDVLVVALTPEGIVLREPRRKRGYVLPYGVAFQQACTLAVDAERREKRASKKRRVTRSLLR